MLASWSIKNLVAREVSLGNYQFHFLDWFYKLWWQIDQKRYLAYWSIGDVDLVVDSKSFYNNDTSLSIITHGSSKLKRFDRSHVWNLQEKEWKMFLCARIHTTYGKLIISMTYENLLKLLIIYTYFFIKNLFIRN